MDTETLSKSSGKSLHTHTDAAVCMAHDLIDRIAKRAVEPEEKIRETAVRAEKAVKNSLTKAKQQSNLARNSIESLIQQHPLAAIGIAIGVGTVIARLRRREITE
ncbi:MAG TPA: hypothetical protein VGK97_07450 [Spongiibacteraceae bacterium]|jgi:ElaB/YqjD/DUF883 family membrane-anchored ribosome-binding protein